jgi:hypothetical protein
MITKMKTFQEIDMLLGLQTRIRRRMVDVIVDERGPVPIKILSNRLRSVDKKLQEYPSHWVDAVRHVRGLRKK